MEIWHNEDSFALKEVLIFGEYVNNETKEKHLMCRKTQLANFAVHHYHESQA